MPAFRDAQHLIEILSAVAERIKFTEPAKGLRDARLVVAFVYHNPEVSILMDGRSETVDGSHLTMKFNDLTPAPDVTFSCSADVGHQFWRGKLDVPVALARGQVKARGAIAKALKLLPLLPPIYQAYRDVLTERGETELLAR